jgi:hypothetical protein
MAVSKNGGLKFDYYKINETSFKTVKGVFFGDYIGLSAVNNLVRPIWMQIGEDKKLSIYTAIINDTILNTYQNNTVKDLVIEKTFKFLPKIKIDFTSNTNGALMGEITKPLDPNFKSVAIKGMQVKKGENQLTIKTKKLGLPKGNYVLTLYLNGKNQYVWITED